MKILFLLISDQHIPNLLSVHYFEPQHIALGVTRKMRQQKKVEYFIDALEKGGRCYRDHFTEIFINDESSFITIFKTITAEYKQLCVRFPKAEWICNITGGNKPMSIMAYEFFKDSGAQIVYIEIGRPNELIDVDKDNKLACEHRPNINEFIAGYGHTNIKPIKTIDQDEQLANAWWRCSRLLALHCTGEDLLRFGEDDKRRKKCRKNGIVLEKRDRGDLCIDNDEVREIIAMTFNLEQNGKHLIGKIDKNAGIYLSGDWLGFFFWWLLKMHEEALEIWDVHPGIEPATVQGVAKNDFDVAFMHDYQLCMIECKTGNQEHGKPVDVLYKIDSVIKRFNALKAQAFLATSSDNIFKAGTGERKSEVTYRAENLRLTIIDRNQIKRLAREPDNIELIKEIFKWS